MPSDADRHGINTGTTMRSALATLGSAFAASAPIQMRANDTDNADNADDEVSREQLVLTPRTRTILPWWLQG